MWVFGGFLKGASLYLGISTRHGTVLPFCKLFPRRFPFSITHKRDLRARHHQPSFSNASLR